MKNRPFLKIVHSFCRETLSNYIIKLILNLKYSFTELNMYSVYIFGKCYLNRDFNCILLAWLIFDAIYAQQVLFFH